MNFHKKFTGVGLLVAGMVFTALPMLAQQEVDPDHFDATPNNTLKHKAVVHHHKSAAQSNSAKKASPAKSNASQSSANAKPEPATVALDSRTR